MKTDSFVKKRDPKLIISNADKTKEDISEIILSNSKIFF